MDGKDVHEKLLDCIGHQENLTKPTVKNYYTTTGKTAMHKECTYHMMVKMWRIQICHTLPVGFMMAELRQVV